MSKKFCLRKRKLKEGGVTFVYRKKQLNDESAIFTKRRKLKEESATSLYKQKKNNLMMKVSSS